MRLYTYFKQFACFIKTDNYVFVRKFLNRAFILIKINNMTYVLFGNPMPKRGWVERYIVVHSLFYLFETTAQIVTIIAGINGIQSKIMRLIFLLLLI